MAGVQGSPATEAVTVAVISPTRLQQRVDADGTREFFIERAMRSALAQTYDRPVALTFILGVDVDAVVPDHLAARPDVVIARSEARSQVAALNAAIAAAGEAHAFVAFLEDDDRWDPHYLAWAFAALRSYDFVSSTQIEVDENDQYLRINDFPTPSGWLMPLSTLERVGPISSRSKWHYDNEWLGRLADTGLRRCHLVEVTAPTTLQTAHQVRPWLANVLRNGGPAVELQRHLLPVPLVIRLMHAGSGTSAVGSGGLAAEESSREYQELAERFGRIPW